jgi:ubiquitin-like modifier-activating enzyme ATG7
MTIYLAYNFLMSYYDSSIRAMADTAKLPSDSANSCILGLVPHQIRGFLTHFNQLLLVSYAYTQCTACSECVLSELDRQGIEFLMDSLKNPLSLEDLTGLTALKENTKVESISDDEMIINTIDLEEKE